MNPNKALARWMERRGRGMQADAQAVIEAFGKNEHVMKVIWALVVTIKGLVITKVLDPGMAQEVVGVLTTGGCEG
ncbi:MAG: hypothetical protein NTV84_00590 [Methanoregula sp.]|nr:hypothetical protein [Methanoregula sp.]